MRRISTLIGAGAVLLASPAIAHVGDHGEHGAGHFLAEHGLAAALIAAVLLAGAATYVILKRKG
ncbi:MAG: hypothetical protein WBF53_06915 [Litorimonas sp.]